MIFSYWQTDKLQQELDALEFIDPSMLSPEEYDAMQILVKEVRDELEKRMKGI